MHGSASNGSLLADPSMAIIPPVAQYRSTYTLHYFQGTILVQHFVNIILINTDSVRTQDTLIDGNSIDNIWAEISCENDNEVYTCAYGVQIELTDTMNGGSVTLSHLDPDAQLMAIVYSNDYRTGSATFSGMTQKPIAGNVIQTP